MKLESDKIINFIEYLKKLNHEELTELEKEISKTTFDLMEEKTNAYCKSIKMTNISELKKELAKVVEYQEMINYNNIKKSLISIQKDRL